LDIFEIWPPALIVTSLALGLVVGSFLNVVAFRLPIMMQRAWAAETDEADGSPSVDQDRIAAIPSRQPRIFRCSVTYC
jgi:prepilin signal peptidase PulO-like enzyme (type II secretory pathway)